MPQFTFSPTPTMPPSKAQGIIDVFDADVDAGNPPLRRNLNSMILQRGKLSFGSAPSFVDTLKRRASEALASRPALPSIPKSNAEFMAQAKDAIPGAEKALGAVFGVIASPLGAAGETLERKAATAAGVPPEKIDKLAKDTGDVSEALLAITPGAKKLPIAKTPEAALKALGSAEKIASPAISDNGKIYTGKDHEAIRQSMPEGSKKGADANTGFVTDKGRFIGREEAQTMAKAQGQFKQEVKGPNELHSEELKALRHSKKVWRWAQRPGGPRYYVKGSGARGRHQARAAWHRHSGYGGVGSEP